MGEGLRKIPKMLAGSGVDLLGVKLQRAGEREQLLAQRSARSVSPIMASAVTSQKEQIVKVPSSPSNPVSVSCTR